MFHAGSMQVDSKTEYMQPHNRDVHMHLVRAHTYTDLQGNAAKRSDSAVHLPSPHFNVARQQKAPYRSRDNQPYLIL